MVDPDARRLIVASALRLHVARTLGTGPLSTDLHTAGRRLRPADDRLARVHGLSFEPTYPGTGEVEDVRGGQRLVLTCQAAHRGEAVATVVTTLIGGRSPQVTVMP